MGRCPVTRLEPPSDAPSRPGIAAPTRQEILLAGLGCYYADGGGSLERPDCQKVAVVAYGSIRLCATCDAMRSAVGRTDIARKLGGAELSDLIARAKDLARAEDRVDKAVRSSRVTGASWSQIGDALGISRQAAQERFGRDEPNTGTEVTPPDK